MLWRMSECLVSSSSFVIDEKKVSLNKVHVLKLNALLWFQLCLKLDFSGLKSHCAASLHIARHQHACMTVNRTTVQIMRWYIVITESSAPG